MGGDTQSDIPKLETDQWSTFSVAFHSLSWFGQKKKKKKMGEILSLVALSRFT